MRAYFLKTGKKWGLGIIVLSAFLAIALMQSDGIAKSDKATHGAQQAAYKLYQNKCTGCHDSVADPEKPGRTRDEWHLVVNIMHGRGMEMTEEQSDMIVDLLYALRKGMEKDPG